MRVLFDQGTPVPLRRLLAPHDVATAYELGWSSLRNGELMSAAESSGFHVLLTTDQRLRHQQSLAGRSLAVVVLTTTSWPRIEPAAPAILRVIATAVPGTYADVTIP